MIAELVGVTKVLTLMESIKPKVRATIKDAVRLQAIELTQHVKKNYLEGPRPTNLSVGKTGNLKRSISYRVTDDTEHIRGIVGTTTKYGIAWELGFDRKVGAGARGGPKSPMTQFQRFRYFIKHPSMVKHFAARPFLKPSLDDREVTIRLALEAAVRKALP